MLKLSSNMTGNDDTNFPHGLSTINSVLNLCKAFANNSSGDIKLLKTQFSIIIQSGGFLGRFIGRLLGLLLKTDLPSTIN